MKLLIYVIICSRMRTSGVGAPIVDNIGYLPPIPDIQEEDSGCQLPQDDYYSNHDVMDQMNASKSVNFFNYLVVPKLQQGEIATFRSILPAKCSRQTASLAFMHILGKQIVAISNLMCVHFFRVDSARCG